MKYCVRYCTGHYVGEEWSRNGKPCGEGMLCDKNERGIRLWDTKTAAETWAHCRREYMNARGTRSFSTDEVCVEEHP